MRKLGGSDIPKLLGISPYGGPFEVFERVYLGIESEPSSRADRGIMFEPVLRACGQRQFGLKIEGRELDYHEHPTLDFARAQIDDLAHWEGTPCVVDYKTVGKFVKGWGAPFSEEIPEHIRAQVTWELACVDRELGLVVAGFGEDVDAPEVFRLANIVAYQVQRDRHFEALCIQVASEFWNAHILTGSPPVKTKGKRKTA